jgi:PAS domain S-box-containing protein
MGDLATEISKAQRDLAIELSGTIGIQKGLELCLDFALKASGMDCGGIYLVNEQGGVDLQLHKGLSPEFVELVSKFEPDAPNTKLIMQGNPVYANFSQLGIQIDENQKSEGLKGIGIIPINYEGKVIGCMNISSHLEEEIPQESRYALETIAAQTGSAIMRLKAETALKESEQRFKLLAELLPQPVYEIDLAGRFSFVNEAALKLSGYSKEDVPNKTAFDIIAPESRAEVGKNIARLLEGAKPRLNEYVGLKKDGTKFPVEIISSVIMRDGKPAGLRGVIYDLTGRRKLEEQIIHSQKMEAVGQLAAGVAHDYNNMLTAILGGCSLSRESLEKGRFSPESLISSIDMIEIAATRAAELTRQLLGFARKGAFSPQDMDLNVIVKEVSKILKKGLSSTVQYNLEVHMGAANYIHADGAQIHQVIQNLVINARDTMPEGGKIIVRTEDIELTDIIDGKYSQIPAEKYVKLSVADNGTGIPEEHWKKIVEPFFTTKDVGKGTGMGLATTYGIASRHEAHLDFDTGIEGTTFNVYFNAVDPIKVKAVIKEKAAQLKGKGKVLVVEDEYIVMHFMQAELIRLGYDVSTARDGSEALEVYRKEKPDVVLMDIVMPGMNGVECFDALRKEFPDVKVYAMSGFSEDDRIREMMDKGAYGFIQKPFRIDKIALKINKVMD